MSYDSVEKSVFDSQPYELFLFQGIGISFALTSSDVEIAYLDQTYEPSTITRSEMEHSNEVVSGQLKIYLPTSHPLAQLLLPYLPSSPIAVTIFGSHFSDTETVVIFTGSVASARFTDQCEITCNSDQYLLQRKIPAELYQSPCSHIFGDSACGINLALHTYAGSISAIDTTGTVITVPAFGSLPDSLRGGYFRRGNDVRMIVDHTGSQITLIAGISGLQVADAVSGVAGCQLTYDSCVHYKNVRNFLGFDLIPTINPFNGSASIA